MKIIRWNKERTANDTWTAPTWVKKALEAGLAFAYLLVDEERPKVAAWAACYIDDGQLEIISLGQDQEMTDGQPLERVLRKLQSFCMEREIRTAEIELLDAAEAGLKASLIRSDYVRTVDDRLWKLSRPVMETFPNENYEIKAFNTLSSQEKSSMVQLFKATGKNIPQFRGSISSELMLVVIRDEKVEACIFASRYRGTIFIEQLVCKDNKAGCEAWKAICQAVRNETENQEIYADDKVYSENIFGKAQSVERQVYTWRMADKDQLTVMDLEAELSIRDENADTLDALLLSKVYLLADIFTEEDIENFMAVDEDVHPKLFAVIRGAESDYMMNVRPILDDMDAGLFRYEITTSFYGKKNKEELVSLCGQINERISEGTIYLSTSDELILRNYVPESVFTDSRALNRMLHNWDESCRFITHNI